MSVSGAFSLFKPNPLYRNLRDDTTSKPAIFHHDDASSTTSDHHDGKLSVMSEDLDDLEDSDAGGGLADVDDDLMDQVRTLQRRMHELQREKFEFQKQQLVDKEMASELATQKAVLQVEIETLRQQNDQLQQQPKMDDELISLVSEMASEKDAFEKQNGELQNDVDELYELMEKMHTHVEALELHEHSLVAYVNKLCNDVKMVKRRSVWQKIEFDKERQQIVEELHSWKRRAEELKAKENDAVAAAEATAAWDVACLNRTIEELQGEILILKSELDETKEELTRRGGSADDAAESEQMLEALQDLALDLKTQLDESNAALDAQKSASQREIDEMRDALQELKQRTIKQTVVHDKERQELVEELSMWKNKALETHLPLHDATPKETKTETAPSSSTSTEGEAGERMVMPTQEEQKQTELATKDNQMEEAAMKERHDKEEKKTKQEEATTLHDEMSEKVAVAETHAESDNQREHSRVSTDDEEEDCGSIPESPLAAPQRSSSFFNIFSNPFALRSRTDSISSTTTLGLEHEPPVTPRPPRSRANSTASSTTSTASSTTRAKSRVQPPPPSHSVNDFFGHQEPVRMNSFKHFL